jgi:glycosyltransferase involved in cell wall biosynthesis
MFIESEENSPSLVEFPPQQTQSDTEPSISPSLAVVIPALQEGRTISNVLSKLSRTIPHARIVVVDGNSSDATVENAHHANAKVVSESRRGYGRAIRTGISSVSADVYAIVDADDTYDLSLLPKMLSLGAMGKIIVGRREGLEDGSMSLSHRVGNVVLSFVYRLLYGQTVSDTQSGFKLFPAKIARQLREDGMTLSSEILIVGRAMGCKVVEVPVQYRTRDKTSRSKFNFWKDGIPVLTYLVSSRFRKCSSTDQSSRN